MDCTRSAEERGPPVLAGTNGGESLLSHPVPFGHVPYSPALPGAMGPLWDFPAEWWFYVGWAHDQSMSKHFTILIETLRFSLPEDPEATASVVFYGIGSPSCEHFSSQWSIGAGFSSVSGKNVGLVIPPPTSKSWSLEANTSTMNMTCALTSGTLGLSGAKYKVGLTDAAHGVSASFELKDVFGMILEGASGSIGKLKNSYEFAMPSLTIERGTIMMDGVTTELGGGNLWLDRQSYSPPSLPSGTEALLGASAGRLSSQLYVGNWLGVVMNDHVYVLVFFWPQKQHDQWIVGSELQPPVDPIGKMGLEYPPVSNWDGQSPVQGVNVLDDSEFDLNIFGST